MVEQHPNTAHGTSKIVNLQDRPTKSSISSRRHFLPQFTCVRCRCPFARGRDRCELHPLLREVSRNERLTKLMTGDGLTQQSPKPIIKTAMRHAPPQFRHARCT